MSLASGTRLSWYEVLGLIGAGGMGEVYKARDTRLDRFVAIKVLPPERVEDPDRRRRFIQEAKAASALNHPNIVTVHSIDSADGVTFIVMEYVAGKPLDEVLLQRPLKLGEVLGFAIQIAGALAAAHAAGIVHRDLKPSNIIIGEDGRLRILDFGLAKLTGEVAAGESAQTASLRPVTHAGTILGTCAYMSPEQAEGGTVDSRSDIFSFGVVLYEMLTRRHPFRRESMVTTMAAIVGEEPKPLSQEGLAVPPEVERAVLRCLRKEPERRWQGVSDLRSVFEDLKTESDSGWRRSAPVTPVHSSRRALWLVASAAVVLAAAVGTLMWIWRGGPAAKPESAVVPLTLDAGLSTTPSVSRDGKIVAYASDRGGDGRLDIWIRRVDRPQSVRRVHDPVGALMPAVSPDGSRIVFVSGRDGGGLYVADTLGGEERKLISGGLNPRFSPDGKWVLYTRAVAGDQAENKTFVISPDGGEPRQVHAGFVTTPDPNGAGAIWSPDSRHVLFNGERADDNTYGWWVAPVDGGAPMAVDIRVFPEGPAVRYPAAWPWDDTLVYAEGITIEGLNLYSIGISPGPWRLTGSPKRLTSGPGLRTDATVSSDGRLVFSIGEWTLNLFSLARDAGTGKATGEPQALTRDKRTKSGVAVSADGAKIVYGALAEVDRTQQAAALRVELRLRDVPSGHETVLSDGRSVVKRPRISRDGSHVGYREVSPDGLAAFVWTASGGSRRVCTGCRILGFFPNADEALVLEGSSRIVRQDLSTGSKKTVLAPSTGRVIDARLSDDGRRVALVLDLPGGRQGLYVAPVRDAAIEDRDWMSVEESDTISVGEPCWSPDGSLLYYLSDSDGHSCIWARRVDRATGRLAGASFPAFHAHSTQSSLSGGGRWNWGLNVTHDRMYVLMAEIKGNVWTTMISH